MADKPTSFILSSEVRELLKLLAAKQGRSQAKQIEMLVKEAATKEGVTLPKPPRAH